MRERRRRAQLGRGIAVRRRRLAGEQLEGALVVDEKLVGPQRLLPVLREPDGREEQRPRERRGKLGPALLGLGQE